MWPRIQEARPQPASGSTGPRRRTGALWTRRTGSVRCSAGSTCRRPHGSTKRGASFAATKGCTPAETTIKFGLGKVRIGSDAFASATRDWIERGADSEFVWSSEELAARRKPVDDDTLLAEPTFKLALHFEAGGDSERALRHFEAAQRLAPDNWNYHRQGWTHKGTAYAHMQVLKRTTDMRKNSDKNYYDPMELPGENHHQVTQPDWIWTPAVKRIKSLLSR